ncbi:type II secretion system F family protein [Pigmentibacter ruber]|uniref:type II secretion system F family protein n=1 Tax=Pigmentibacter ruber TaxID=2683196 RepID=UPI00131D273B|nr:type II secretion system F family protein [Pigmentibacter ruber]BFD32759.1 type II secretion system inner membrane protein GspF [Pigmentibacter ruber]
MPMYSYKGQNARTGKKLKAYIEAESPKDAKQKLKKQGIYVLELKIDSRASAAEGKSGIIAMLNRKPPKPEDIANATKQFAILLRSAVDINDALRAIADQVENDELKSVYVKMRELVSEGKSLSDAHKNFPKVFSSIYTNMIAAAEKAGALPLVMQRLSEFINYQIEIKRKVVGALTYPALMVVMAIAVVIYLFVKVMPQMTKSFTTLKVTLPWYTVLMNDISNWMQDWWLICVVFLGLAIFGTYSWSKTEKGRQKLDTIMYTAPVIGPLIQKVTISRFSKTLSTILSSGVRIVEGLQLTRKVVGNSVMEKALDEAIVKVQDGDKLAIALERTGKFPTMVIHMLKTGEKTGQLEEMLVNISNVYDDDVNNQIVVTTRLIEPAMMIFMAGVVFVMVMSVIGPMMAAMNQLH